MKKLRQGALALLLVYILMLAAPTMAASEMEIDASAVVLMDATYGDILYAKNPDGKVYPASTTKIMTAVLAIETIDMGVLSLESVVTASSEAIAPIPLGSSHQSIKPGEEMTMEQLLYCLMVASANDSANVIAQAVAGSMESFVERMNTRAAELGLTGTHFMNAHGLHNENHYTTARDLAALARYAMTLPLFRVVVGTDLYLVPATNLSDARELHTTNYMLSHRIIPGYTYSDATGIKTGSTDEAGYCLVSSARKDDRELIAVVMGTTLTRDADNRVTNRPYLSESKRLLEWGFTSYSRQEILSSSDLIGEVPVSLSAVADYVVAHPEGIIEATISKELDHALFERTITWHQEAVEAPVEKGQALGTITVSYEGEEFGTVNLVALSSVEASAWMVFWKDTGAAMLRIVIAVIVLAVLIIVALVVIRSRRRQAVAAKKRGERSGTRQK